MRSRPGRGREAWLRGAALGVVRAAHAEGSACMLIRVGIPVSFQYFSGVCREIGAPILISANVMRRRDGSFRRPRREMFSGCDVALDSAGFVAMVRYKGYPWSREEYIALAKSYPWAWYASRD